jgi:uncharacterized protein (DUF1778 family)
MSTAVISIRLNSEDQAILGKAAKFHGMSLPKYTKWAARRDAEDAIDLAIADAAHLEYEKNPSEFRYTVEDLEREFLGGK